VEENREEIIGQNIASMFIFFFLHLPGEL